MGRDRGRDFKDISDSLPYSKEEAVNLRRKYEYSKETKEYFDTIISLSRDDGLDVDKVIKIIQDYFVKEGFKTRVEKVRSYLYEGTYTYRDNKGQTRTGTYQSCVKPIPMYQINVRISWFKNAEQEKEYRDKEKEEVERRRASFAKFCDDYNKRHAPIAAIGVILAIIVFVQLLIVQWPIILKIVVGVFAFLILFGMIASKSQEALEEEWKKDYRS